ncbi:MAG: DUF1152 domain-containing protein [Candidatus Odinarchaeota archaeon]
MQSIISIVRDAKRILVAGMGGGGDIFSALPTYWNFHQLNAEAEIILGGISEAPMQAITDLEPITCKSGKTLSTCTSLGMVTSKSHCKDHRLIERIIARVFSTKCLIMSLSDGAGPLIGELQNYIQERSIDCVCFVDGGADSLASENGLMGSVLADTLSLAVLSKLDVKYKLHGLTALCADLEMDIHTAMTQIARVYGQNGCHGLLGFPPEHFDEFQDCLEEILKESATGTGQAIFYAMKGYYGQETVFWEGGGAIIPIFPISSATWYFNPEVTVKVNYLAGPVSQTTTLEEATNRITELLEKKKIREKVTTPEIIKTMYFWN